jgi:hypothetical protein
MKAANLREAAEVAMYHARDCERLSDLAVDDGAPVETVRLWRARALEAWLIAARLFEEAAANAGHDGDHDSVRACYAEVDRLGVLIDPEYAR